MTRFETDLFVEAPPAEVFDRLTQVERFGEWMPNFVRAERLDEGDYGVGSRWREVRRMFGKEAAEVFEVTAVEPGRRIFLKVDGAQGSTGKGEFRFEYDLVPEGSGTRMVTRSEIDMPGFAGLMTRLFLGPFRKAVVKDHEAFKRWVESTTPDAEA